MKKPDEAVERACRVRIESRLSFVLAHRWRKEFRRAGSQHLHAAEVLCLFHSLELGLKAFALFEAGAAPPGHDLSTLLRALSPGLQSQLVAGTGDPVERFEANLELVAERRSIRRDEAHLVDADLAFLRRFARSVQKALYGHASATRKPVVGTDRERAGDDAMSGNRPGSLSCSFCGKAQHEVRKLIAGPTVHICDECVRLCNDILAEEIAGEIRRVAGVEAQANRIVRMARTFAEACEQAVELPRPVAERARALAEEIEIATAADAHSRAVLGEYATSVAIMARRFAKACDAVELPRSVAERARSLFVEIEALMGPRGQE